MRVVLITVLLYLGYGDCNLWPKGVVHYSINHKDYDLHSQDLIKSVFEAIERELCVKFFHSPSNKTLTADRMLYVSNPDKLKNCPARSYAYDFSGMVVDMPIGYKCINSKDVSRLVVDMLRASIDQNVPITGYELVKKFQDKDHDSSTLLSPNDRNYINSHYYRECGELSARPLTAAARRSSSSSDALSPEAVQFYEPLLWPLGVVMYGVEPALRGTPAHTRLKVAMTTIELGSCVVFQFHNDDDVLAPKNILYFANSGEEMPDYGFKEGNQTLELNAVIGGVPGHTAHALNNMLRALGVPMMSNRHDRDNYVIVNWKNVDKGKEHLLEKLPEAAWVPSVAYNFSSATHAPANFACKACALGEASVLPIQDHLWQRTLSMGHTTTLSSADIRMLALLYGKECQRRLG